jgi:hypothetical protein
VSVQSVLLNEGHSIDAAIRRASVAHGECAEDARYLLGGIDLVRTHLMVRRRSQCDRQMCVLGSRVYRARVYVLEDEGDYTSLRQVSRRQ